MHCNEQTDKAEQKKIKEAFDLSDHKGKKQITSSEIGNALKSAGRRISPEAVKMLVKKADEEQKGVLDLEQFKKYYQLAIEIEKRDDKIRQALLVFDNGADRGLLNARSLKHALTSIGDKLSADEVCLVLYGRG